MGHVASVPDSPSRGEESLASLVGGFDAPSNPLAVRPRAFTIRGGNAMGWVGCKEVWPPFFIPQCNDMYMHACLACSTVLHPYHR